MNSDVQVEEASPSTSPNTIIEGWLKKPTKYFFSARDFYRVTGKVLLMAGNPNKRFSVKHDLTNYQVQLSQADERRFYLQPNDNSMGLNVVAFEV